MTDPVEREELHDQAKVKHCSQLASRAAEILRPYGREHVGTISLHFYAGTNVMSATGEIQLVTQVVDMRMSAEAAELILPEVRDRIFEALGGKKLKLAPQTVEETKDMGQTIIKTDKDQ